MKQEFEERIKTFKAAQKMLGANDDIFFYEVEGEDPSITYECVLRPPNRIEMREIIVLNKKDEITANEHMLNKCWICGDEIIKTNDKYFLGISYRLGELLSFVTGELKKV